MAESKSYPGLSPRLRGNLVIVGLVVVGLGSIPAPAGEPGGILSRIGNLAVYPRACGGTMLVCMCAGMMLGLSPRLRGNPVRAVDMPLGQRSIPAPAGEPKLKTFSMYSTTVYPRACGGTRQHGQAERLFHGLSPRLRGNRLLHRVEHDGQRSIPAPAGEPWPGLRQRRRAEVYPRACGGTFSRKPHSSLSEGLSPRLRGNLYLRARVPEPGRSIPAPAGEPPRRL